MVEVFSSLHPLKESLLRKTEEKLFILSFRYTKILETTWLSFYQCHTTLQYLHVIGSVYSTIFVFKYIHAIFHANIYIYMSHGIKRRLKLIIPRTLQVLDNHLHFGFPHE